MWVIWRQLKSHYLFPHTIPIVLRSRFALTRTIFNCISKISSTSTVTLKQNITLSLQGLKAQPILVPQRMAQKLHADKTLKKWTPKPNRLSLRLI